MSNLWKVSSVSVQNGSKLFETFDINAYRQATQNYSKINVEEKKNYKGVEDYVFQTVGFSLSPLNKSYKKYMKK